MRRQEPRWLTLRDVLALHEMSLREHGGAGGVRDKGLLESALARPRHLFAYGERDPFRLAAAYAQGITRNHPFVDGNKRTAFLSAFVFLGDNGLDLVADEADLVRAMLALTERKMSEAEFAVWLRTNTPRRNGRTRRRAGPTRRDRREKP